MSYCGECLHVKVCELKKGWVVLPCDHKLVEEKFTPTNSAMDAIALAEKYHSILPLGKQELERVTMQRFMVWLREQQHQ